MKSPLVDKNLTNFYINPDIQVNFKTCFITVLDIIKARLFQPFKIIESFDISTHTFNLYVILYLDEEIAELVDFIPNFLYFLIFWSIFF